MLGALPPPPDVDRGVFPPKYSELGEKSSAISSYRDFFPSRRCTFAKSSLFGIKAPKSPRSRGVQKRRGSNGAKKIGLGGSRLGSEKENVRARASKAGKRNAHKLKQKRVQKTVNQRKRSNRVKNNQDMSEQQLQQQSKRKGKQKARVRRRGLKDRQQQAKPRGKSAPDTPEQALGATGSDESNRNPAHVELGSDGWPLGLMRFAYPIIPWAHFDGLSLLAHGGVGAALSTRLTTEGQRSGICSASPKVVLKAVLKPRDWDEEITGYSCFSPHRDVVGVAGVTLVPAGAVNQICKKIKKYQPRTTAVPCMVFEEWNGSIDVVLRTGRLARWGLLAAVKILLHAARGLRHLHRQGFVHRDVKPENILFRLNGARIRACLCDLGMVTTVRRVSTSGTEHFDMNIDDGGCGTRNYMAPEVKSGRPYSLPADIYSLAITTKEVVLAARPHCDKVDPLLHDIVRRGRMGNPRKRPSADEFVAALENAAKELKRMALRRAHARPGLRKRRSNEIAQACLEDNTCAVGDRERKQRKRGILSMR